MSIGSFTVPIAAMGAKTSNTAVRAGVNAQILIHKPREFLALGVVLGSRLVTSPALSTDDFGTAAPPNSSVYVPSANPGSLAPHVWLAEGKAQGASSRNLHCWRLLSQNRTCAVHIRLFGTTGFNPRSWSDDPARGRAEGGRYSFLSFRSLTVEPASRPTVLRSPHKSPSPGTGARGGIAVGRQVWRCWLQIRQGAQPNNRCERLAWRSGCRAAPAKG